MKRCGALLATLMLFGIAACSTQTVNTTAITPSITETANTPETELLDIGVAVFDPGLEEAPAARKELTFADMYALVGKGLYVLSYDVRGQGASGGLHALQK